MSKFNQNEPQSSKNSENQQSDLHQQQICDPAVCLQNFLPSISSLITDSKSKLNQKNSSIPKFLFKIFMNNLPEFPDELHRQRMVNFFNIPIKSVSKAHIREILGSGKTSRLQRQNQLNRRVLKRILDRNYENIFSNSHIKEKKQYLMLCKKLMLALNKPSFFDDKCWVRI